MLSYAKWLILSILFNHQILVQTKNMQLTSLMFLYESSYQILLPTIDER